MVRAMMVALVGFGFLGLEAYGEPRKTPHFEPDPSLYTERGGPGSTHISMAHEPSEEEETPSSQAGASAASCCADDPVNAGACEPKKLSSSHSAGALPYLTFANLLQGEFAYEIGFRIFGFMDAESQTALARASSHTHTLITQYRMETDPRGFSHRTWVDGPPADTLENYLLNAMAWYLEKRVIIAHEARKRGTGGDDFLRLLVPLYEAYSYLDKSSSSRFSFCLQPPEAHERIRRFFISAYEFIAGPNLTFQIDPKLLSLARNRENVAERGLVRLWHFLTSRDYDPRYVPYADLETNPDRMSPLTRHFIASRIKARLISGLHGFTSGLRQYAEDWDFVLRYAMTLEVEDYRFAARAQYFAQNFTREAELREKVLTNFPDSLTVQDYKEAAHAQYESRNFNRAAELCEKIIRYFPDSLTVWNYKFAADAQFLARNFARAAELSEKVLTDFPHSLTAHDYREAAHAQFKAQNFARAAELRETVLTDFPDSLAIDDHRNAAKAQFRAHNFKRAVELREIVLTKFPDSLTEVDYRFAAAAQFEAGNFARAAKLREIVLTDFPHNLTAQDYKDAAYAQFKAQNYARAAELFEKILTDFPDSLTIYDYRNAAIAQFLVLNYMREAELREIVLTDFSHSLTAQDYKEAAYAQFRAQNFTPGG